MQTFRNIDIAKIYGVSNPTVINWINAAVKKQNMLKLTTVKNKLKVIDSPENREELQRLKDKGTVHKSTYIETKPTEDFYKTFTPNEVAEIATNLDIHKEISLKFTYKGIGGQLWDQYVIEGKEAGTYTTTTKLSNLLANTFEFLEYKIAKYNKVNIIDIGPGNCESILPFLTKLAKSGKLGKYIAVDISQSMLDIAKKRINKEFQNVEFEGIESDIEKSDLLEIGIKAKKEGEINIFLFVGSTIGSLDEYKTLANLKSSLSDNDILYFSNKVFQTTEKSKTGHVVDNYEQLFWIPEMLGIKTNPNNLIGLYDDKTDTRTVVFRPDNDYQIEFDLGGVKKQIRIYKGEDVVVWRHKMSTTNQIIEDLGRAKLSLTQMTKENDFSHVLIMCELDRGKEG